MIVSMEESLPCVDRIHDSEWRCSSWHVLVCIVSFIWCGQTSCIRQFSPRTGKVLLRILEACGETLVVFHGLLSPYARTHDD